MKTKESVLREMLLEIALGSDKNAPRTGKDDKEMGSDKKGTIVPISPSMQSPIQLSVQKIPIQDPKYSPKNKFELSRALAEIGELVPDDDVEKFYESVRQLYSKVSGEEIA